VTFVPAIPVELRCCEHCGVIAGIKIPVDDVVHCELCLAPISRERLVGVLAHLARQHHAAPEEKR
jgi:hypothetical protein